ncbi:MAG: hypothetical protein DRQ55_10780 [Planctomycetota bacterium]|nr:MAG: hypothetical protein DRQ55_10780 [Planctomycetota bacterium]
MDATVIISCPARQAEATALARRLGLPLVSQPPDEGLALHLAEQHLELLPLGPGDPGPVRPEFVSGAFGHRRRAGLGAGEPLARAVGMRRHGARRVLDATPGLGRDSFLLAAAGCTVLACERHPVMATLLSDALERAAAEPDLAETLARIELRCADARDLLGPHLRAESAAPEVIVMDPMFPVHGGSALVRKELRVLRRLVGDDPDAGELLACALASAVRVVVRRPASAPPLASSREPSLSFGGRRTRLDVYLPA